MKKVIITTLVQSLIFVLIYTVLGYFFNKIDVSIIEYFKSELNKNLVALGLMFILFFIGNYINRNKEITWETIFKKQKRE
jgi:Kef-type K+ transport system membrane component KefB